MTLSQFFILSPRGDVIINKDFRGDSHPTLHDTFFRKVRYTLIIIILIQLLLILILLFIF